MSGKKQRSTYSSKKKEKHELLGKKSAEIEQETLLKQFQQHTSEKELESVENELVMTDEVKRTITELINNAELKVIFIIII